MRDQLPLPATIVCADWSGSPAGRAVCLAKTVGPAISPISPPTGGWTVERVVGFAREERLPGESLLVGFDAPIGLPRSYWDRLMESIEAARRPRTFAEWLASDDFDDAFFDACSGAATWSIRRPFFRVEGRKGGRKDYERVIAEAGVDSRRRLESLVGGMPLFIIGGVPGAAGGSACDLWRGLRPLRRAGEVALWPFDGRAAALSAAAPPMVGEIYPRLAYASALDGGKAARSRPESRRGALRALLSVPWVRQHRVTILRPEEAERSEDVFDAMLSAAGLLRRALQGAPVAADGLVDDAVEGGMLLTGEDRPPGDRVARRPRGGRSRVARPAMVFVLRITLRDLAPPIWRELRLEGSRALAELHDALQIAFGWMDTHLHEFAIGGRAYGPLDEEADRELIDDATVRVDEVLAAGDAAAYLYDFGDGWVHDIVVVAVTPRDEDIPYPLCTGGARACPPDDAGGPGGYQDLIEQLLDPAHGEHAGARQWVGGYWDPEGFDANAVNRALRERMRR
jgi:hypothetical protein